MKKALSLTLALAMMLTMLAACGSDSSDSTTSSDTASSNTDSGSTQAVPDADVNEAVPETDMNAEPDGVQPGTAVTISSSSDFVTMLLPGQFNGARTFYGYVYDTLFWDPDLDEVADTPLLATGVTYEDDGYTWVIDLREDVSFHNGNNMTAEHVISSFEFYQNERIGTAMDDVVSYEATGEYQVTVKINAIGPYLPSFASAVQIFDDSLYQEIGLMADAAMGAGTGPYMLDSYSVGDNVVLKAVENYYDESRQAHIETLTMKIITNTTTAYNALCAGDLDFGGVNDSSQYEMLLDSEDHYIVTNIGGPETIWISSDPYYCEELANVNVRKALCMMVNLEEVMLAATGGYGGVGTNFMNIAFTEYTHDRVYDPEGALAILAEEGVDPADLEITAIVSAMNETSFTNIQAQLMDCGVTLNFVTSDQNVVMTAAIAGEWDLWNDIGGMGATASYLNSLKNILGYNSSQPTITDITLHDQVADLVDLASITPDHDAYWDILAEICQICDENYLYLSNYYPFSWCVFANNIANPSLDGTFNWKVYDSWIIE